MSLIKWEPFEEFDRAFGGGLLAPFSQTPGWDLAVDVYEEKDAVIAEMNVPGLDAEKIDVSVEDGLLHVSGSREEVKEEKDAEKRYYRKEIRRGSFERSIRLDQPIQKEKVTADYQDGVLKITMPKALGKEDDKIKVKVKG